MLEYHFDKRFLAEVTGNRGKNPDTTWTLPKPNPLDLKIFNEMSHRVRHKADVHALLNQVDTGNMEEPGAFLNNAKVVASMVCDAMLYASSKEVVQITRQLLEVAFGRGVDPREHYQGLLQEVTSYTNE